MDKKAEGEKPKQPKIKAEDNPWYRLATLYGMPRPGMRDAEKLQVRNREAWNRWMAFALGELRMTELSEKLHKRYPDRNLKDTTLSLTREEEREIEKRFAEASHGAVGNRDIWELNWEEIDFSNVEFDTDFWVNGFVFPSHTKFVDATFSAQSKALFSQAYFLDIADFTGATFNDAANFTFASFCYLTDFKGTKFLCDVTFESAKFFALSFFKETTFEGSTSFEGVNFFAPAFFQKAKFLSKGASCGHARFEHVNFALKPDFEEAKFFVSAIFKDANFLQGAAFKGATFYAGTSFVNAKMEGETTFEKAQFASQPPKFFGAKLHEGTVWRGIDWPLPKISEEADAFVNAYERLKLEMDKLKKHEDELNFFALELQSRRGLDDTRILSGLAIDFYGIFSDFGRCFLRPFLWLVLIIVAGATAELWPDFTSYQYRDALGHSAANTFGALGFRTDFIGTEYIKDLPSSLKVIAAIQTVFGIVLLFLFGLAIRNRLRMK